MTTIPRLDNCRSCGAAVIWLTISPGGRRMPVDADPADNGNILVDLDQARGVVIPNAALASLRADTPDEPLYRSHFVSCPQAADWRRK